jgi:hypothetical protein
LKKVLIVSIKCFNKLQKALCCIMMTTVLKSNSQ